MKRPRVDETQGLTEKILMSSKDNTQTLAPLGSHVKPSTTALITRPSLNEQAFSDLHRKYIDSLKHTTSAPKEYHFAMLNLAVSMIVGRRLCVHYGQELYPNTYLCLVGDSTTSKKTTSADYGVRLLKNTGVDVPVIRGLSTWEGLLSQLDNAGSKALIIQGEFSQLLRKAKAKYSENLIPNLVHAYDCPEALENLTKSNPVRIANPYLSLVSTTNPEWLVKDLPPVEIFSGFMNRFQLILGTPGAELYPTEPPNERLWESVVSELKELNDSHYDFLEESVLVKLTSSAQEAFREFLREFEQWGKTCGEDLRAISARIPQHVHKTALILSIIRKSTEITKSEMEAAVLYGKYLLECIQYLFSQHMKGWTIQIEDKVLQVVSEKGSNGGSCRRRDIQQAVRKVKGQDVDAYTFGRIFEAMKRNGVIKEECDKITLGDT